MMTPSSGKPTTTQDQQRVRKLRDAGMTVRDIAKEQRLSTTTVVKILQNGFDK